MRALRHFPQGFGRQQTLARPQQPRVRNTPQQVVKQHATKRGTKQPEYSAIEPQVDFLKGTEPFDHGAERSTTLAAAVSAFSGRTALGQEAQYRLHLAVPRKRRDQVRLRRRARAHEAEAE